MGIAYASVFPEPVGADTHKSPFQDKKEFSQELKINNQ
jgi:hypothetical protein